MKDFILPVDCYLISLVSIFHAWNHKIRSNHGRRNAHEQYNLSLTSCLLGPLRKTWNLCRLSAPFLRVWLRSSTFSRHKNVMPFGQEIRKCLKSLMLYELCLSMAHAQMICLLYVDCTIRYIRWAECIQSYKMHHMSHIFSGNMKYSDEFSKMSIRLVVTTSIHFLELSRWKCGMTLRKKFPNISVRISSAD